MAAVYEIVKRFAYKQPWLGAFFYFLMPRSRDRNFPKDTRCCCTNEDTVVRRSSMAIDRKWAIKGRCFRLVRRKFFSRYACSKKTSRKYAMIDLRFSERIIDVSTGTSKVGWIGSAWRIVLRHSPRFFPPRSRSTRSFVRNGGRTRYSTNDRQESMFAVEATAGARTGRVRKHSETIRGIFYGPPRLAYREYGRANLAFGSRLLRSSFYRERCNGGGKIGRRNDPASASRLDGWRVRPCP